MDEIRKQFQLFNGSVTIQLYNITGSCFKATTLPFLSVIFVKIYLKCWQ